MPARSSAVIWRDNFAEHQQPLGREDARVEASRCLYCYDAPCVKACPTSIDVPRFIRQIAAADDDGAGRTILEANALGGSCARVCPVESLCEGACVYHEWQQAPIEIARLQRFATDAVRRDGGFPFEPGPANGKSVAIVGAGPAGVSCAAYLRRLGYAVTIYDRRRLPGGLDSHGVAEYKMTQREALRELKDLFRLGCVFRGGRPVDAPLAKRLMAQSDAVFLGVGLKGTRRLEIPGEKLVGVIDALTFIERVKAHDATLLGSSRATVVIGGGNTAIDAATQSCRTGVDTVTLAYRRARKDMSAYGFEIETALSDGARLLTNAVPQRILGRRRVEGVEFVRSVKKGARFVVECDRVILAIGQEKDRGVAAMFGFELRDDGTTLVDPRTLATTNPKIFAGGDAINGGKEVVNAVADGKRAAWGIHRFLHPGAEPDGDNAYWVSTIEPAVREPIVVGGSAA